MDNRKKKDILIIVMLIAVVCMSSAFAVLSQKLEVSGTGTVKGNWGVEITGITPTATQGTGTSNSANADLTVATFAADLYQPGDSVTYTVTVENTGNIDAKLDSISSKVTPEYGTDDNQYVNFTYDGIASNSVLKAGESISFNVTVQYSSEVVSTTTMNATLTTVLNYVQNS